MKEEVKKEKLKLIAFKLPQKLYDLIQKYAEKNDRSVSNVVRIAIKEFLRKRNEDGKL